jgi:hypothetical protein
VTLIVDAVPLRVGLVLKDVTLLLEDSADVGINALEPVLELRVAVGIRVDLVNGINQIVGGRAIGETLK